MSLLDKLAARVGAKLQPSASPGNKWCWLMFPPPAGKRGAPLVVPINLFERGDDMLQLEADIRAVVAAQQQFQAKWGI